MGHSQVARSPSIEHSASLSVRAPWTFLIPHTSEQDPSSSSESESSLSSLDAERAVISEGDSDRAMGSGAASGRAERLWMDKGSLAKRMGELAKLEIGAGADSLVSQEFGQRTCASALLRRCADIDDDMMIPHHWDETCSTHRQEQRQRGRERR